MYGIFTYIHHKKQPNVWYGMDNIYTIFPQQIERYIDSKTTYHEKTKCSVTWAPLKKEQFYSQGRGMENFANAGNLPISKRLGNIFVLKDGNEFIDIMK